VFKGKKYISSNPNISTNNFNLYSDVIVDHEKYLGHYPFIEDTFISKDDMEYCHGCMKQLNIFDEDMQQFRPRTETDNEIVKSVNFKGKAINFKRLI
jgi:hypothetical protein